MQLHQLLKECKRQSITAQKHLYGRFATQMFLLCRRYVKSDEEAEEAMMNGFLKFFKALTDLVYVNDAATVAWLKKIMVNECLMHLRISNGFLQLVANDIPDVANSENVVDDLSADEIFVLITQLPIGYRTVFNLFVIEI